MSYMIQQSTTTWELLFLMVQSSDHITGLTGASPTVTIRKSGGAFASPSGAVTEIANGWYKVAGNATDTNTLGPLLLHATAASGDPTDTSFEVVAFNPQDAVHLGLTALPNTAVTTNGSLLTSGTGTDQISVSAGKVLLQATQSGVTIPTVTTVTNQLTAAAIATGVWQDATAGDFTTASSIGKSLYTSGVVPGGTNGLFIAGTNAATAVNITGNLTGNVTGSVGSVTGNVGGSVASVTAITTSGGKISGVVLVDTLTTYTGNTPQTGDAFARIGVAGVGLTNLGDTRVANLDAAVSTRMATYTQPTGFLAATFPATVASPTNITAGTITTVTNLTNAATAGDLTAAMKTSVENAAWDATLASHLTAGSTGKALSSASSVGDPWSTALPGAYAAGTAGNIVGNKFGLSITGGGAVAVDGTSTLTEAYPAAGSALTLASALYSVNQIMGASSIPAGTTKRTVFQRNGTTPAMTFTINSPNAPSSISQTT